MHLQWYCLHVKPHKEQSVYKLLLARRVVVYYPYVKVEPVNPRARKERPFFPGYMFVFLDIEAEGMNALRWTEGTYGLVQFGGEPVSVPDSLIHELKATLDKIMVETRIKQESYTRGDRVRIVGGLFDGYEAIFDTRLPGKHRVQVLLAFLSDQPKRLQLNETEITKASGRSKADSY